MDNNGAASAAANTVYMNSPDHKVNILALSSTRVGFAVCRGQVSGFTYWVSDFGSELSGSETGGQYLLTQGVQTVKTPVIDKPVEVNNQQPIQPQTQPIAPEQKIVTPVSIVQSQEKSASIRSATQSYTAKKPCKKKSKRSLKMKKRSVNRN